MFRLRFVCDKIIKDMEGQVSVKLIAVYDNDSNELIFKKKYTNSVIELNGIDNGLFTSRMIPGREYNIDITMVEPD